jgi:hypothetical protein
VRLPHVAVLAGDGVAPASYGAHWYFLEEELGLPFDAVLAGELVRMDLSAYQVIVIPDAMDQVLDEAAGAALKRWVEAGGRLVAVAGGARVAAPLFGVELRAEAPPDTTPAHYLTTRQEREREAWLEQVPGVILPTHVDLSHPLAWGAGAEDTGGTLQVLHEGGLVFEPGPGQEVVAYFPTDLRATSGTVSRESLRRLEKGAWLTTKAVGRGSVVLFADDPLFRLFWRATQPLYTNALLVGWAK